MDLIADFDREYHTLNGTTERRRKSQRKVLREFEDSLHGRPLPEARPEDLEAFLTSELERGLHVNTVRKHLNMIRPFYSWLWRRRVIDGDHLLWIRDVRPPRGSSAQSDPKPYDRHELDRFYAELDERWPLAKDSTIERWRQSRARYHRVWKHGMRLQIEAVLALALYQGMRSKEIYEVKVDEAHPLNRYVIVRMGTRKGNGRPKYREVPMQEHTRAAMQAWLDWREQFQLDHDSTWLCLHPRWGPAAPMNLRRFGGLMHTIGSWELHRFRHTCGTTWLRAGMPLKHVSEWLGHSSVTKTEGYVRVVRDDLEREAVRASSRFDRMVARREETAA